jgi:hypothetical protein
MQDAADHPPIIDPFLAAHIGRQMRLDPSPLLIAEPKQVAAHSSVLLASTESLSDSLINRFIEFRP